MISALILAGGRARRLGGVDKRLLVVEGMPIFERQVTALRERVSEIIVSQRAGGPDIAGYRTVRDEVSNGGPLAGIAAGLAAARTPWLLVVAGDMPYVQGALVDAMRARATEATDAVGLRVGDLPEPLFTLLRVDAVRPIVARRIAARELKASRLLTEAGLRVSWIDEAALRQIDPTLRMLANINEPSDLGA